jgi:SCP-2 sterol transfer family protein
MRSAPARDRLISLLGRLASTRSDRQLERLLTLVPVQRLLFAAMASSYDPSILGGLPGTVSLRLLFPQTGREPAAWSLTLQGTQAKATPGPPVGGAATVALSAPAAVFVRIGLGLLDPAEALLRGKITLSGRLDVGAMLAEMFQIPSPR